MKRLSRTSPLKFVADCDIKSLKLFAKNPRANDGAIDALVKSISQFGFIAPIIVDKKMRICAGHTRYKAAKQMGIKKLPVIIADGLIGDAFVGYNIADNQTATIATWDDALLADLLRDLESNQFDMTALGFNDEDLAALLKVDDVRPGVDADAVPAPPKKAVTRRGDIIILGSHRLMCGDAFASADIALLMNGTRADAVISDPPYGMDLDTDWSGMKGSLKSIGAKHNTRGKKYDRVIGDDKAFDPSTLLALKTPECFLFGADYYAERITDRSRGSWLVWDKRKESQSEAFGSEFELIWSRAKHKRRMLRHDWFGFLSSENGKDARARVHPTQKPVSLIADIIDQWIDAGATIVDLFGGSGSTLIAAEQTDRTCYMMEIDERYCDVIIERWETFTGKKATRTSKVRKAAA